MKRIFITGADGFVGTRLMQDLSDKYDIKRVVLADNKNKDLYLNLEKPDEFDFEQIKKDDTVVHLAAISSPDKCTSEHDYAYQINVLGTSCFIEECLKRNARVLFFSSDAVYGASDPKKNDYFDENSKCNPLGDYGTMKREVEKIFFGKKDFKIFRLSYVFSKNDKLTAYLRDCCSKRRVADIFHPFCRNVVYVGDIVSAVDELIDKWENIKEPIFNLVGPETISRKEMAELYQKDIDSRLQFKIMKPKEDFFYNRPRTIRVRSLYLEKLLKRPQTKLDQAYSLEKLKIY